MLQQKLNEELGTKNIKKKELPDYILNCLSQQRNLRPYQEECLRYNLTYKEDYE